jgi:acyl-CoA thioester hydrolase
MLATGVDMYYVEANCQYRGRARFDDTLHVHARIGHIGNTSFIFEFVIYKQPADVLIATGNIVAVAVDAETERPVRVPDVLREAVASFEGEMASGPKQDATCKEGTEVGNRGCGSDLTRKGAG